MAKNRNVKSEKDAGKGSLSEAKTNEDFNKKNLVKMMQNLK